MSWKPKQIALVLIDVLLFSTAWLLAYLLRFLEEGGIPHAPTAAGDNYHLQMWLLLPWIVATHVGLLFAFKLYRGIIRYVGSTEVRNMALASGAHLFLWVLINLYMSGQAQLFDLPQREIPGDAALVEVIRIPWGILVFYFCLAFLFSAGIRFFPRLMMEQARRHDSEAAPALIVGAGDHADSVLRGLARHGSGEFRPVCAVATEESRVGLRLHGIPVVGTLGNIAAIIQQNQIEQVLIALEDQSPETLRGIVNACEDAGVKFHVVPSMADIAVGKVEVSQARHIEIEDLLGREQVRMELPEQRNYLRGASVMITGAGGSIGGELARQVARNEPGTLLLLGKGENSIFEITGELTRRHPGIAVIPLVGDVRDNTRMELLFRDYQPEVIFHAAAHKHVPLMEDAPEEAAANNILGTWTVARLAEKYRARRFVMISSDKAVRPSSVMGATKRYAETVILSMAGGSRCCFGVVRFGNVLGSRGSVIPLFREQIKAGGPVTVTHPDMLRYFMTIPEAVALVIQAGSRDVNGGLYLLDMGEPVRIADLARSMIALSGYRPDRDIQIEFTGLRPGEKLKEELLTASEECDPTEVDKLFQAAAGQAPSLDEIRGEIALLEREITRGDRGAIRLFLMDRITDYHPSEREFSSPLAGGEPEPAMDEAPGEEAPQPMEEKVAPLEPAVPPALEEEPDEPPPTGEPLQESLAENEEPGEPEIPGAMTVPDEPEKPATGKEPETPPAPEKEEASKPEPEPEPEPEEADLFSLKEEAGEASKEEEPEPAPSPADEEPPSSPGTPAPPPTVAKEEPSAPPAATEEMAGEGGAAARPASTEAVLILRIPEATEDMETLSLLLHQVTENVLGEGDKLVVAGRKDQLDQLEGDFEALVSDGRVQGDLTAEGLEYHPEAGVLLTTSADVLFGPAGIEPFREAVAAGAPVVYSNYQEDRDGRQFPVSLHLHDGCPHERFDFGPVIAYNTALMAEVGGVRQDLNYAWEYDLHLKLMEKAPFVRIDDLAYTRFVPAGGDGEAGARVHSPGAGPLGGFSYVFYPEEVEREVTAVFEEALRRRNAWLDGPTEEVDHGARDFDVKASVVIPVLNRVKYIANAIDKVCEGTFQDFEIIIVDNGSTDGTIETVQGYVDQDARVRLLHGEGDSIASALNEGIRAARGKYICQLDSDDEYTPHTLERMIGHLEDHPRCGLCISYYRLMDEEGGIIEDVEPITHAGYTRNQILRRDGAGAVRVFPRAVLEEFGLYDAEHYGNFGEDYDMVLKTGEKYDVDRVHEVLYHYRRHEDNTDVTRSPEMKFRNKNRARQEALRRRVEINRGRNEQADEGE